MVDDTSIATGACASKKNGGLHAEDPQRAMTGDSTNACASVSTMIIQNTPGNTKGHLDNTPPPTVDMNEYPVLQRQQVPPTDHQQLQAMETQGPIAASTPGLPKSAHATSGQILEEHWVPDNGSGVSANDNERQMVIAADVDHNADAEITHDTGLEDTGSAEGGIHNDHGDHHVPRNQSPSGDHHAPRDQSSSGDHHASRDHSPSGDHPLHISEVPEGAQGAPTTVASPYGQERNANLSPAADQTPAWRQPDLGQASAAVAAWRVPQRHRKPVPHESRNDES